MVIYKKSLVLSNDHGANEGKQRGDVVNLMSVDASRMQELCTYALIIASGPFQVPTPHLNIPSDY